MQALISKGGRCWAAPSVMQRCAGLRSASRVRLLAPPPSFSTDRSTHYILTTEDKLEIIELCHKFDWALNQGQQDKLGAFFAPDAQVVSPKGTVVGVGAILEYFEACRPVAAGNRHLTCNIVVVADGVRAARATAYRLLHSASSPPQLLASGTIEDRLVNVAGEWRFAQRVFAMDPPAGGKEAAPKQQQQPAAAAAGKQ